MVTTALKIARRLSLFGFLFSWFMLILFLPKDIEDSGDAVVSWRRFAQMLDRDLMLYLLVAVLLLWTLWTSSRPFLRFMGKAKRIKQMRETAREVMAFAVRFQISRPAPKDDLNYVSPGLPGSVNFGLGSGGNSVVSAGDPNYRPIKNAQDERLNHDLQTWADFNNTLSGEVYRHFGFAEREGLIRDKNEEQLLQRLRQGAPVGATHEAFYQIAALLQTIAGRLESADA